MVPWQKNRLNETCSNSSCGERTARFFNWTLLFLKSDLEVLLFEKVPEYIFPIVCFFVNFWGALGKDIMASSLCCCSTVQCVKHVSYVKN